MDEPHLTLIVVPHGDLETRSFVVSYRKLKIILSVCIALLLVVAFVIASWFPVALMAAKVGPLEAQLDTLERDRARVVELAKDLSEVEARYEQVRRLLGADAPTAGSPPSLPPLRDSTESDASGSASSPEPIALKREAAPIIDAWPLAERGFITQTVGSGTRSHPGIDIAIPNDAAVLAAGPGVVRSAGLDSIYGKYIVIDHGDGYMSVYGHASRLLVQPGDRVRSGQKIALTGSTGRSTAPHLHFEIRLDGKVLDPFRFVRQPR
jgi:murein DD-endopeptidase MepM/ murein hydrolase activator NlpD